MSLAVARAHCAAGSEISIATYRVDVVVTSGVCCMCQQEISACGDSMCPSLNHGIGSVCVGYSHLQHYALSSVLGRHSPCIRGEETL